MKSKIKAIMAGMLFCVLLTIPAYAEAVDGSADDWDTATVGLTLKLDPTEEFDQDVEFIIGMMSYHMGPTYTGDRSYESDTVIEPGAYDVTVICPTDLEKRYSFTGPAHVNITDGTEIRFTVIDGGEPAIDDHEEGDGDKATDGVEGLSYEEPQRYHFAENGEKTGKIRIECEYCAAIKSVLYRLNGADKSYDVLLTRDSGFVSEVELPVGSYKESTTIEVELDDDVKYSDGISYTWQHNDNPSFWGGYYEVSPGQETEVRDLAVMMVYKGEVSKADSNVLFAPKYQEAYDQAVEENREELLESVGIEPIEETEAPTIPTLEPEIPEIEEETQVRGPGFKVILICLGIAAIAVMAFVVIRYIKSKRME